MVPIMEELDFGGILKEVTFKLFNETTILNLIN